MPVAVALDTLWGPLELRRRQGGEANAVGLHLCEDEVARALARAASRTPTVVVALAREMSIWTPMLTPDLLDQRVGLMSALKAGRLVVAKPGEAPELDEDGAVWAAFDTFRSHFGREFNLQLRAHRLATRQTAVELRRDQDYDIVPAPEAADIVLRLAKSAGPGPVQQAAKMLADTMVDLKSPPAKKGFLLLRAPMAFAARQALVEEVVTPAKLRQLRDEKVTELEIYLLGVQGNGLPFRYQVAKPNGGEAKGGLDGSGFAKVPAPGVGVGTVLFEPVKGAREAKGPLANPNKGLRREAGVNIVEIWVDMNKVFEPLSFEVSPGRTRVLVQILHPAFVFSA